MTLSTTADALVERVRRDALLGLYGPLYTLASSYTAGGTSIVLNESPEHMTQGSLVAVDYELFHVQSVNVSGMALTVLPGFLGSVQANHAANALLEVDPRFPKGALLDYAEHEIRSWTGELWRETSINLPVVRTERTYDLAGVTGDVYFLLDVRQMPEGTSFDDVSASWNRDAWPHVEARLLRGMSTSEFASGFALQLLNVPRFATTLRVTVAQPFDLTTFTASTDLLATVGLRANWLDILEMGMRYRALATSTTARTDWRAAGMARDSEEVSALDLLRVSGMARDMRTMRLKHEGLELRARYPYRSQ